MKGFFGAMLLGLSVAVIMSDREDWWVIYAGVLLLLAGVELLISERVENAISKLKNV